LFAFNEGDGIHSIQSFSFEMIDTALHVYLDVNQYFSRSNRRYVKLEERIRKQMVYQIINVCKPISVKENKCDFSKNNRLFDHVCKIYIPSTFVTLFISHFRIDAVSYFNPSTELTRVREIEFFPRTSNFDFTYK